MRIDLKEKNHFLTVFETFFGQSIDRPINGISIDSRNIKKNDLFIAIKGENFDGNDFVDEALSKVSNIIIADNKRYKNNKDKRIIWVNDSIKALKTISNNIKQ
mgnify:CR=1 FL=1